MTKRLVSEIDVNYLKLIRGHVNSLKERLSVESVAPDLKVLDIAPQDWGGVGPYLPQSAMLTTLDIDPHSGADLIADICDMSAVVESNHFDVVVCTEVLEHVSAPFAAAEEILRVLKVGGKLYASAPFDFRIHGPLPDNWRFTEHGWRQMLRNFSSVVVEPLENERRPLMPLHYNVIATK